MRWVCAGPLADHSPDAAGAGDAAAAQQKRARHGNRNGLASTKRGRSPQPSEGQQRLQLGISRRLRLLRLTLGEQIIQQSCQPDQPSAPALFTEPEQQAIAAGRELQPAGGMQVNRGVSGKAKRGHGGTSAGLHLQAGRGQGPAPFA